MLLAYYNGKIVDMSYVNDRVPDKRRRFSLACCRVTDNAKDGYVIEGDKVFYTSRTMRTAKLVSGEERDRVLAEVAKLG